MSGLLKIDNNPNQLTTWQFFLIATNYLIGPTFFVQMSGLIGNTKQWAWIPPMAASFLSLGVIWLWLRLLKKYPGKNLAEITTLLVGRKIGFVLSIIFIYLFLLIAALATRNIGDLITTVSMDQTPITVFNALALGGIVYMISKGIRTMGRFTEFITPFLFIIFWGSLLLLIGEWKIDRVIPAPGSFDLKAIQASTVALFSFPYLQYVAIHSLFPLARNQKKARISVYAASIVTALSTIGVVFLLLGITGVTRISNLTYPSIAVAQEIRLFETLENLDVLVTAILATAVFIKVAVLIHASLVFLEHILNFPYRLPLLILLALTTLAFSIGVHDNIIENVEITKNLSPIYSMTLGIFLPLLLFLISLFRKEKHG